MRRVRSILKGIWRGLKDVAPIATREAKEAIQKDIIFEDARERALAIIAQQITSKGLSVVAIIYALDYFFNLGLFS